MTVGDEKRVTLNVALAPGADEIGELKLTFTEPLEGSTVNTETVTVYGAVSGFEILSVKVNETAGEALGGGGFSATVPLTEGANTLTAVVTGINGERLSGVLHLTRKLTAGKLPDDMKARGTCSATGGLPLIGLLALAALRRRRH